jgi:hypothetical protein
VAGIEKENVALVAVERLTSRAIELPTVVGLKRMYPDVISILPVVAPVPLASFSIQFPDQFVVPLLLENDALLMLSSTVLLLVGKDTRAPLLPLV